MSKSKKLLGVILALMMIANIVAISASAVSSSYEEAGATFTQAWSLGTPVKVNDTTYTVDVSLTTNYPVGAIQFVVKNTANTVASMTGVAVGAAYYAAADVSFTNDSGKVLLVPQTSGTDLTAKAMNGVVATITYTYSGTGGATLSIDNAPKTAANPSGTLIAARMSSGYLNGDMVVGQTVTGVGSNVSIGAVAAAADLALKASAASGIVIDTHKTFGGLYAGAVYGFVQTANNTFMSTTYLTNNLEATNGGSLAFSRSIGATGYGTGTVITVKNSDTSESKKYVVVIFADVDGNGLINVNDYNTAMSAVSNASVAPSNSVKRMAANCQIVNNGTMMHTINVNDYNLIKAHISGTKVNAVGIAEKQYAYNNFYQ